MKVSPFYLLAYIPLLRKNIILEELELTLFFRRRSRLLKKKTQSCCYDNASFCALFSSFNHCMFNRCTTVVQLSSVSQSYPLFATPHDTGCQGSLSCRVTNSQSLLKLMSIELVMPSNHLILYHPLLLLSSIFPSIRVFSNESVLCIRWPRYWNFSISPSNENSGLISFRIDWFDLFAGQGTLKSLLQHHTLKASILWHSAFFIVQLSHPYMTTGKSIALTI